MPVQTRSQTALTKATIPQEPLPRNAKGYPSVGGLTIQKKNRHFGTIHSYGSIYEGEMISRKKDGKGKMIDSCLKPKQKEKQENGEVFTPMELVFEMLDNLDKQLKARKRQNNLYKPVML